MSRLDTKKVLVEDLNKITTHAWKNAGDSIWLLGAPLRECDIFNSSVSLCASIYLENIETQYNMFLDNLVTGYNNINFSDHNL